MSNANSNQVARAVALANAKAGDKIDGLKKEVNRQAGFKRHQQKVSTHTEEHLINSWAFVWANTQADKSIIENMIWDFIEKSPTKYFKEGILSSDVGLLTTIDDYTNKKGYTTKAHFTANGHYYGSVKEHGEFPIAYRGNFMITRQLFRVNRNALFFHTRATLGEEGFEGNDIKSVAGVFQGLGVQKSKFRYCQ